MNGRLSSMKNGWRPFPKPPLGYRREKLSDTNWYIDVIDEEKWSFIKEGLELYAYNPMFSQSQLHKYWVDKGIQPSPSSKRLYFSIIEKTFNDYRLYFYAGYIYYPEWGLDVPVKWKHKALISLETAKMIMEKERYKTKKIKSSNIDENLELHPLKGMITCSSCGRKLGCYASRWNGGVYCYYTCNNKYCTDRISLRKEIIESQFEEFIETMKLPKQVFETLKSYIVEEWNENKKAKSVSIPQMQWQLLSIKSKMEKIEEKILSISNPWLTQKMEQEWSSLDTLKEDLIRKMKNQKDDEDNIEQTLSQTEYIFTEPVQMWRNSNYELRQLLFMVWFGGILYYKKNSWYRTNETTGLHWLFSLNSGGNSTVTAQGGTLLNPFSISEADFDKIITILTAQSKYINAIHKVCKIHGWDITKKIWQS